MNYILFIQKTEFLRKSVCVVDELFFKNLTKIQAERMKKRKKESEASAITHAYSLGMHRMLCKMPPIHIHVANCCVGANEMCAYIIKLHIQVD